MTGAEIATLHEEFTNPVQEAERAVATIVVADGDVKNPPVLLAAINSATPVLQMINALKKKMEARRTDLVKPLNDHVKKINAAAKGAMAPIVEAEAILKRRVLDWQSTIRQIEAEELRKRQAEEERRRKIQESHAAKGHEVKPSITPVPAPIPLAAQSTAKTRKQWKYEVVDIRCVPAEYLQVDHNAVMEAIRAGMRVISGVRIFDEDILITA